MSPIPILNEGGDQVKEIMKNPKVSIEEDEDEDNDHFVEARETASLSGSVLDLKPSVVVKPLTVIDSSADMYISATPSKQRRLYPRSIFDEADLDEALQGLGVKSAQTRQKHIASIYRHLIQKGVKDEWESVPNLPKAVVAMLKEKKEFVITTSKVVQRLDAKDGSATKLMIMLQDGQKIETVIMRYGQVELASFPEEEKTRRQQQQQQQQQNGTDDASSVHSSTRLFKSNKRATVCVSSQVGCAMGCTFCATGTMGLMSNLTAGEILEQLYHANQVETIRNVVFMGMGEPLDNYTSVLAAIKGMTDTGRFALSPQRVTISTVGVVPRLKALLQDAPQIGLALSLHAPTQEMRVKIVPTAKAWHINKIVDAATAFVDNQNRRAPVPQRVSKKSTKPQPPATPSKQDQDDTASIYSDSNAHPSLAARRHILIEYVLIADLNDSPETGTTLGRLLSGRDVLVNVIPYNPTDVAHDYKAPSQSQIDAFLSAVRAEGVVCTVRQELGQDIASACGQLVISGLKKSNGSSSKTSGSVRDLEDLVGSKSATGASGAAVKGVKARRRSKRESEQNKEQIKSAWESWVTPQAVGVALGVGIVALVAWRIWIKTSNH